MITKATIRKFNRWWNQTWAIVGAGDPALRQIGFTLLGMFGVVFYLLFILISPGIICFTPILIVLFFVLAWFMFGLVSIVMALPDFIGRLYRRWYDNLEDGDESEIQ